MELSINVTNDDNLYSVLEKISYWLLETYSVDELSKDKNEIIPWDDIMNYIREYSSQHDGYNIFPEKLHCYNELLLIRDNVQDGYNGSKPFIRRTCRDCHSIYYIYKSEKDWMTRHGYPLPKRCTQCRKRRNSNKQVPVAISGTVEDKKVYAYE